MLKKFNKIGIYSGLSMASLMALLSITGNHEIGLIKYLKFLILFTFLVMTAFRIKKRVPIKSFFQTTMLAGVRISILAGLILAFTTLLLYGIDPAFAPMKFNLIPQNGLQAFTIAVMLFFETIALGFILNFAVIQGLKPGAETVIQ